MRGKPIYRNGVFSAFRITPAGAGKTKPIRTYRREVKDHPRRCGENREALDKMDKEEGSPPQVRGKLSVYPCACGVAGITPAGAGKTKCHVGCNVTAQDHPRRCGENQTDAEFLTQNTGSPPQVRGKQSHFRESVICKGITPAGAGKTGERVRQFGILRDHPRRCGENFPSGFGFSFPLGSPPQVRGKRSRRTTT